ncbi:MAG: hypothetical protein AAGE96_09235 [Cyanobacteria bacterium P01_G01_bin.19]
MNTKFKKLTNFVLSGLPLIALAYSIAPITVIPSKAIALSITSIAENESSLSGTWRATDEAVAEMYGKVYESNPPDKVTGDILMVFEDTGDLKLVYDDVNLNFDGVPPVTMTGDMMFTWQVPKANVFEMNPQSYDFKVETLGISIPVPENIVPSTKSPYDYQIEGNVLKLTNVPEGIYIPLEWEKM